MNMPPWSFSGLTSFETCPKRYYHIKVVKDVIDLPGEAARWGSTVHTHLENFARDGVPMPPVIAGYQKLVEPFLNRPGTLLVEQQMAVKSDLTPTTWESPDAWCRGIVDLGFVSTGGNKALLLDWKTGKRKPESDQLQLFAGLAFSHYASLTEVQTGFVWLKENKTDKKYFTRSDISAIWQGFIPRVNRMERAYTTTTFPAKPSGLCKNYCPVPKSKCSYSGKL